MYVRIDCKACGFKRNNVLLVGNKFGNSAGNQVLKHITIYPDHEVSMNGVAYKVQGNVLKRVSDIAAETQEHKESAESGDTGVA